MSCYKRFCRKFSLVPFPCCPDQARLYATFLSDFMAPASVANYLSALWGHHLYSGYPSHATDFRLRWTLRGIRRLNRSSRARRHPLSVPELNSMFLELNTLLPLDLPFWAAVVLAFRGLLRKSHYTFSNHTLKWRDISMYPDHVIVRINTSKTDQFATKGHRVILKSSPGSFLCPVFWLGELSRVHKPLESDYVIRVPSPWGLSPMDYRWFNAKLKSLSSTVGLNPKTISSHSLRHGGASFMAAQGSSLMDIRARGGWASSAVFRYLHHTDATLLKQDLLIASSL